MPSFDRRQFFRLTLGSMAQLPFAQGKFVAGEEARPQALPWYQQPLRILQTVLREPDAQNYRPQEVINYMLETGANVLVVNGGGIVDFFQNPLRAANKNKFMGERDLLKEVVDAGHQSGLKVMARVDFRGVEEHVFNQFPAWFARDENDQPRRLTYTRPPLYQACYTGVYRNEHAMEFIHYLMDKYHLDGIWHNSIGIQGLCYCSRCQEKYAQDVGLPIPVLSNSNEIELSQYMVWKTAQARAHMQKMRETVKSFGDEKAYSAEVFSMYDPGQRIHDGIDLYLARDYFDFLISVAFLTENTELIHYADLHYASTLIRFLKALAPDKEAVILYGGNGTSHRYVMDPEQDLKAWLWLALSAGGRFWNCSFTGMHPGATYDHRTAYHQQEAYQLVRDNSALFTRHVPYARVAIYYSKSTRQSYQTPSAEGNTFNQSIQGMVQAFNEHHLPFEFLPDETVSAEKLRSYLLIVLANVRCLSDVEIALLKEYVQGGGQLLATYESSLYNETGAQRTDFGLGDLFGVEYLAEKVNTRKDCYQYIAKPNHPILKPDSDRTELLINAGHTLLCKTRPNAVSLCTYVPMVQNQPPEKAWVTSWPKDHPTVVENHYGQGRVIYFANQPDVLNQEIGHPDFAHLLMRSALYLAPAAAIITTNAPESVHITLTRAMDSPGIFILSLTNTSSAPVRPLRTLIPVYEIEIKLSLPGQLRGYKILRGPDSLKMSENVHGWSVRVPKLVDFVALYFELE